MRLKTVAISCLCAFVSVAALAADAPKKKCCAQREKAQQSREAKAERLRSTLTGQLVDKCCCVQREGKTHCTLADKDVATCCCRPVAEEPRSE